MKLYSCAQHESVSTALQAGHWPEACDPALRAHVEGCASCSDLLLVTQTLQRARTEATQAARLPSPGILWWRAQLRRRNAAIESVTRPIAVAEKIAVLIMLIVVVALAVWQHDQIAAWLAAIWGPLANIAQIPGALLVGFGALLFFGAFAVYLFAAKE